MNLWHEVPQPTFLSWASALQHAYCRARDLDAATRADTDEEKQFHLRRADMYQEMIDAEAARVLSR